LAPVGSLALLRKALYEASSAIVRDGGAKKARKRMLQRLLRGMMLGADDLDMQVFNLCRYLECLSECLLSIQVNVYVCRSSGQEGRS
jgi:hypothetical protein